MADPMLRVENLVRSFGGIKATDLQKVLTGKLVSARPFIGLSSHGVGGGRRLRNRPDCRQ